MRDTTMIRGHELMALQRFQNDTRHMIVFDVLSDASGYGEYGDRRRLYLSDAAYENALTAAERHEIRIRKHTAVVEGYLIPDKKKKRRGH